MYPVKFVHDFSRITSKLSERSIELADLITERGKILNPEYSICRDQPTTGASPLRINVLLSHDCLQLLKRFSVYGNAGETMHELLYEFSCPETRRKACSEVVLQAGYYAGLFS